MAHKHSIYDSDSHFSINPITRVITNVSSQKTKLVQFDHNSERFTFELPKYIEGHDMSACNVVEIHYLNVDATTKVQNEGVYAVDDLQISPEDENVVICSWLISQNATQLVGSLNFLIRFACVTDGMIDYAWNTTIFSGISVSSGIYNGEVIVGQYADVLEQWKEQLTALNISVDEVNEATASATVATENATIATNNAIKAAETANGAASGVVTIEQNSQSQLRFWVGTQTEYDALEEKAEGCFYIISDDTARNDIVNEIKGDLANLIYPVGSIYMSVNSVNPSLLFGGTWEMWGAGKVPVGVNTSDSDFASAEKTGGEKTHKLTNFELAPHYHGMAHSHTCTEADLAHQSSSKTTLYHESNDYYDGSPVDVSLAEHQHGIILKDTVTGTYNGNTSAFPSSAEQKALSLMQPYITCYMWKRIA